MATDMDNTKLIGKGFVNYLKSEGLYPEDIIEYFLLDPEPKDVYSDSFWTETSFQYGEDQNILLCVNLHGKYGEDSKQNLSQRLLLFTAPDRSDETLRKMAAFGASCMSAFREYVAIHSDDFKER